MSEMISTVDRQYESGATHCNGNGVAPALPQAHLDYWSFPFARMVTTPTIGTMHGRLDLEPLHPIYHTYEDLPLVSISDSQRKPLHSMNWVSTIHHGLPAPIAFRITAEVRFPA